MNESLLNRLLRARKRQRRMLVLILCLSMIVSLGTFAGFHKNAIAKVYTREVLDCPYAHEGAAPVAHTHNDDCYEGDLLVCTLPEREAHMHADACYAELQVLRCGLEESEGHQHTGECFDEDGALTCGMEAGEGAHVHSEACFENEYALICDQPELPTHVHGPECFRTEEITVDEPQEVIEPETPAQPEQTIPEMPVSDPNADLETAEDWNREFENFELSGNWARDLVLVAATQQGRGESPNNFEAVLNDAGDAWVKHGYTRYGAWYGVPYADEWSAMFVSFCLRYAGIPAENVPNNPTAAFMAESFSKGELFAGRDYVPAAGDLIFFGTVDDDIVTIDHMGIVYHVDAEDDTINTVEGDRTNAVATFGYHLDDERIVGYGILPQNPNYVPNEEENTDNTDEAFDGFIFMTTDEEEEKQEETTTAEEAPVPEVPMPAQSWERTAGGIKVSVEAPEGAFPENTKIAVTPVNGNSLKDTVSDAVNGEVLEVQAVDITFFDAEGHEIEPAIPIRVSMTPAATEHAEEKTNVVHVDVAQQTAELIEQAEGTETDNSEVVFDAEAFTIYAIVYTVDFEYEVDGKIYEASFPGAQDIALVSVIKELGIEYDLQDIERVRFSKPEQVSVKKLEDDWVIRVLKNVDEGEYLIVTTNDGKQFNISIRTIGITEAETDLAVISTVNDLFLPEDTNAYATVLTGEQSAAAIAVVRETAPAPEIMAIPGLISLEAKEEQISAESEEPGAAVDGAPEEAAAQTTVTEAKPAYQVYEIGLENVDAAQYRGGFQVALTLPESITGKDFRLYQVQDGEAVELEMNTDSKATENGTEVVSAVSFVTPSFAEFVLSYTVEVSYEVDGQTYTSTVAGATDILLSDILKDLGGHYVVENVESARFSNPELVRVTELENDWSIRPLKEIPSGEALTVLTKDGKTFTITITAHGTTEAETELAVIRTVNDVFLPESASAHAEMLNEEQRETAVAAVQGIASAADTEDSVQAELAAELDAAAAVSAEVAEESGLPAEEETVHSEATYQVFEIGIDNLEEKDYEDYKEGFEVAVSLPESVTGRDFRLYHKTDTTDAEYFGGISAKLIHEGKEYFSAFVTDGTQQSFTYLPDGTYQLKELHVPAGYVNTLPAIEFVISKGKITNITDSVDITHEENDLSFTIKNHPGVQLPQTGGIGTGIFTAIGAILSCSAGAILTLRKRKQAA